MMMSSPRTWRKESSQPQPQTTIRVIAPATLEQDFTFDVTLGGKHGNRPYTVTVPEGGVLEGEEFDIPYPSWDEYSDENVDDNDVDDEERRVDDNNNIDDNDDDKKTLPCQSNSQDGEDTSTGINSTTDATGAPVGRWRNHLLSCCDVVTQSTFWMAIFCIPVLMAQLVSRLNLSYMGVPAFTVHRTNRQPTTTILPTSQTVFEDAIEEASLSYNKIVLSFVAVLCFTNFIPAVGLAIVAIYILLLMVFVGSNLRRSMRQRYNIPLSLPFLQVLRRCFCRPLPKKGINVNKSNRNKQENDEGGGYVEDCLCLVFCGCCSLIQMGRHTHDDKEYPGYCCTTTGLEVGAPKIV